MKIDDFLDELNKLDKELQTAYKEHAPEKNHNRQKGVRDHKPGANPGCTQCIKIIQATKKTYEFEQTHLGTSRMHPGTMQNTIKLIRSVVKMMSEGGEIKCKNSKN